MLAQVEGGSELGKQAESYVKDGSLVPDELVIEMVCGFGGGDGMAEPQ